MWKQYVRWFLIFFLVFYNTTNNVLVTNKKETKYQRIKNE